MAGSIASGVNLTVGDDLSSEVLSYNEQCRPPDQVIEIELSRIVFGEWVKIAKIQLGNVGRGCLANGSHRGISG